MQQKKRRAGEKYEKSNQTEKEFRKKRNKIILAANSLKITREIQKKDRRIGEVKEK